MSTKQSITQSMVWAAYGDALGFITELCKSKSDVQRRTGGIDRVTGLVPWVRRVGSDFGSDIELPVGCYSDDTQLRLATSRSIRGDGFFDVETFSKVELPVWLSYALGAGVGTKAAAASLKKRSVQWHSNFYKSKDVQYIDSGGNGSVMRIQPHVWSAPASKREAEIIKDVIRNTVVTHGHCRAIVGAAFHALCLRRALTNRNIPGPSDWISVLQMLECIPDVIRSDEDLAIYWLPRWEKDSRQTIREAVDHCVEELRRDIQMAEDGLPKTEEYDKTGESYSKLVRQLGCLNGPFVGSAPKTALLASYLSYVFKDRPHNGLVEAVNLIGSDTDTIATMAGAIMGVVAPSYPPERVTDQDYLESEAERLYELGEGCQTASFAYPDMLYWDPPATQLDAFGEHEGRLVIRGLGKANPIPETAVRREKSSSAWQWLRLEFGQTVLIRRRPEIRTITRESLPLEPSTLISSHKPSLLPSVKPEVISQKQTPKQPELWDRHKLAEIREYKEITINRAADLSIQSGFREEVVGSMLMKLAVQEYGIDKAIAFAAIIARHKQALMKKGSKSQ
jgi:ADP-ribosylglycohydrolase